MRLANFIAILFVGAGTSGLMAYAEPISPGTKTEQVDSSTSRLTPTLIEQRTSKVQSETQIIGVEATLHDLSKCLRHMRENAKHIQDEAQRTNIVVVATGDEVGPIIEQTAGTAPAGGYLPPRKKFLDLYINQLRELLKMVDIEVATFKDVPESIKDTAGGATKVADARFAILVSDIDKLSKLTSGPDFDNQAIADQAKLLQEDLNSASTASKVLAELKKDERTLDGDVRDLDKQIQKERSAN